MHVYFDRNVQMNKARHSCGAITQCHVRCRHSCGAITSYHVRCRRAGKSQFATFKSFISFCHQLTGAEATLQRLMLFLRSLLSCRKRRDRIGITLRELKQLISFCPLKKTKSIRKRNKEKMSIRKRNKEEM